MSGRIIGLIDCNNFFASCEKVFRPDLAGVPLVILSNNDGCVISRSAEAKKLGIPMGVPVFKIRNEIERYGIAVFSCNFALYGDLSNRIMNNRDFTGTFSEFCSIIKTRNITYTSVSRHLLHLVLEIRPYNGECPEYIRLLGFRKEKMMLFSPSTEEKIVL